MYLNSAVNESFLSGSEARPFPDVQLRSPYSLTIGKDSRSLNDGRGGVVNLTLIIYKTLSLTERTVER